MKLCCLKLSEDKKFSSGAEKLDNVLDSLHVKHFSLSICHLNKLVVFFPAKCAIKVSSNMCDTVFGVEGIDFMAVRRLKDSNRAE